MLRPNFSVLVGVGALITTMVFGVGPASAQALSPLSAPPPPSRQGDLPPCALLSLEVMPAGSLTLLNGQSLDRNVWLISLLPGEHRLEIRKDGFRTYYRSLAAASGERLSLSVTLEKAP